MTTKQAYADADRQWKKALHDVVMKVNTGNLTAKMEKALTEISQLQNFFSVVPDSELTDEPLVKIRPEFKKHNPDFIGGAKFLA